MPSTLTTLSLKPRTRTPGRVALTKRAQLLAIALERFRLHRAATADDRAWAGQLRDVIRNGLNADVTRIRRLFEAEAIDVAAAPSHEHDHR